MKNPMNNPNIEYGGGGSQEHVISQIVQVIVRIMNQVRSEVMDAAFPTTFDHDCSSLGRVQSPGVIIFTAFV